MHECDTEIESEREREREREREKERERERKIKRKNKEKVSEKEKKKERERTEVAHHSTHWKQVTSMVTASARPGRYQLKSICQIVVALATDSPASNSAAACPNLDLVEEVESGLCF